MSGVSTHVLDLALGRPVRDVLVRLERQEISGAWKPLASARTDQDGRCAHLLGTDHVLEPGLYRLAFETAGYFASQKIEGLYPLVEITFQVRHGDEHFHIPLLLSANGYTTYRGS
jgi:5-hydroxyisourate hydrolase